MIRSAFQSWTETLFDDQDVLIMEESSRCWQAFNTIQSGCTVLLLRKGKREIVQLFPEH